ncbi:glycine zipper domain-containing protein [Terricaulis sp.]|jgi:ElaB/YqjD/DUF883 family membrane-anchored ribosome-binding protein|uniref:glycine zipper domain-containing protein n=1 Tax=Terricaulis sp. TaxID=2768686 RepID=UPI002AC3F1A0|nr:hypothetical protein [Terricaulis sp.]MDZ4690166.1 hypothetical protein [Terricaulis sp.]
MSDERSTERAAEAAADAAGEAYAAAEEAIKDGLDEANRFLQRQLDERPLTVAATALGVGLVLGLLLSRKS